MYKSKSLFVFGCLIACLLPVQFLLAEESLSEFECLHLNIGLLSLLETENAYFQRKQKQEYDTQSGIGQGLTMLRERGETCAIKQALYVEAAEYSLHFRKLDNAAYFLQKALQSSAK